MKYPRFGAIKSSISPLVAVLNLFPDLQSVSPFFSNLKVPKWVADFSFILTDSEKTPSLHIAGAWALDLLKQNSSQMH